MNKFIAAVLLVQCCCAADAWTQNGGLSKYQPLAYNGMARILIRVPGPYQYDTIYFKNGIATYNQQKYDGEIGWIYATDIDRNSVHYVILEKGTISIMATKDSVVFVTGTPNNDALFKLDEQLEPLRMKMKVMQREWSALTAKGDSVAAEKLRKTLLATSGEWWGLQMQFALSNGNMAGLNYVNKLMTRFTTPELKKIMEGYSKFADKNAYKSVAARYHAELRTDIGVMPPPFSLVSDKGEMLALSGIKKKLTIVDFWASWCKPCRAENPNLTKLYRKWKEKGLEIVSVSIDKEADKDKWLKAIEEDQMSWIQLWDQKGGVNKAYGITAIPRTFILDQNGTIVGKDLRGEELNKLVEDLLEN